MVHQIMTLPNLFFQSNPFFLSATLTKGVLNEDLMVWLDVARPPLIESNHEFGKVIIC